MSLQATEEREPTDSLQLQEASHSQTLVLLGNFNHPDIYWESSTTSCKQCRRILECMEGSFLGQVIDSPARGDMMLDLMDMNAVS